LRVALENLAVIVHPADGAKGCRDAHHHPDIGILEVRPQQAAGQYADQDKRTAHGGRARLAQVALGTIVPHHLPDLVIVQLADDPGADQQRQGQRCQDAENAAHSEILEYRECTMQFGKVIGQPEQHGVQPSCCSMSCCTTRSMPALLDPLTSTHTRGASLCRTSSASSAQPEACVALLPKLRTAKDVSGPVP